MERIMNQIVLLKKLLSGFVEIMYVDNAELVRMHDFIFNTKPVNEIELNDHSEIYETLDFLRDLADERNLSCVEELFDYFGGQQEIVVGIIREENKLLNPGNASNPIYNEGSLHHRSSILTNDSVQVESEHTQYESIVHKLFKILDNNKALQSLEGCYREIYKPNKWKKITTDDICGHSLLIMSNSNDIYLKNYYKLFAPPKKQYSRLNSIILRIKGLFSAITGISTFKAETKVKKLYASIYNNISKDRTIENEHLKMMLSKIMLGAKLNYQLDKKSQLSKGKENDFIESNHESDFSSKRKLYRNLSQKKWAVLKSPEGLGWNTTENPGFSIDMAEVSSSCTTVEPDPYWNKISDNSVIYFPLSRQYCLRLMPSCDTGMTPQTSKIDFELSSEQELEVVNKLSLVSQPEVLVSPRYGVKKRTEALSCEL